MTLTNDRLKITILMLESIDTHRNIVESIDIYRNIIEGIDIYIYLSVYLHNKSWLAYTTHISSLLMTGGGEG